MAALPSNQSHARSTSLPVKPHPLFLQCNEHLCSIIAASDDTSGCSSSSLVSKSLSGLQDLHDCVEKLFQLSITREAVVQGQQDKWVEELLDGSLRLLDVCTVAKDAILHTKECARELQSIIRQRRGGKIELAAEVSKYLTSRKVVRKAIHKALGNLKGVKISKSTSASANLKDDQTVALVSLLREVEAVSLSTFKSLMSFISGPTQVKSSSWSLVSKLMHNKRVACTQEADTNEFAKVDAALQSFIFHLSGKSDNFINLQSQLGKLESCIQDFEEGLESLFRCLIKIRVTLLNILNH